MVRILLLLAPLMRGLPALPQAAPEQGVRVEAVETRPLEPRTGEKMDLQVQLQTPPGLRVTPPDTLTHLPGIASRGPVVLEREEGQGAVSGKLRLIYPLLPLSPGTLELPPIRLKIEGPGVPGGASWILLSLATLTVVSVIPPELEDPVPTPAFLPELGRRWPARPLAVAGLILGLGSGLVALGLGRFRRGFEEGGEVRARGLSRDVRRPEAPSARELRKELALLLGRELDGAPLEASRWEEVLLLFRTLLLAELGDSHRGKTTPEILVALAVGDGRMRGAATEGGNGVLLAEVILREGDRMRFGGTGVPPEDVRASLLRIRSWMEVGHA